MMAAHATCTMNGSPSATWPTASTTAADAGAADTICAATLAAAALSATYAFKRDVALSSVSRAHRARHGASHAPFPSIPNLGATAIEAPRLASRRRDAATPRENYKLFTILWIPFLIRASLKLISKPSFKFVNLK